MYTPVNPSFTIEKWGLRGENYIGVFSWWLGAFWVTKDAKFLHADNEDSDQTVQMRRLTRLFIVRMSECTVCFLTLRLICHRYCMTHTFIYENIKGISFIEGYL